MAWGAKREDSKLCHYLGVHSKCASADSYHRNIGIWEKGRWSSERGQRLRRYCIRGGRFYRGSALFISYRLWCAILHAPLRREQHRATHNDDVCSYYDCLFHRYGYGVYNGNSLGHCDHHVNNSLGYFRLRVQLLDNVLENGFIGLWRATQEFADFQSHEFCFNLFANLSIRSHSQTPTSISLKTFETFNGSFKLSILSLKLIQTWRHLRTCGRKLPVQSDKMFNIAVIHNNCMIANHENLSSVLNAAFFAHWMARAFKSKGGILPRILWKYKEPLEEEAADGPAPVLANPLVNGSYKAGEAPAILIFRSPSPVKSNHRQVSGGYESLQTRSPIKIRTERYKQ